MSTAMPGPVPAPPPAPGGPPHRGRRAELAVDALVTAAAALELLTLHGALDTTSALVCPPALLALLLRRRFPVTVLLVLCPEHERELGVGNFWK
ncbi:hypothetical protein ACWCYZ_45585 [Streptomyces virginiae]